MQNLNGVANFSSKDIKVACYTELDLSQELIRVYILLTKHTEKLHSIFLNPTKKYSFDISDLVFYSKYGPLKLSQLPPFFVSGVTKGGWSIDDCMTNLILNMNDNNSNYLILTLRIKRSIVTLSVEPYAKIDSLAHETVLININNNIISPANIPFIIGRNNIDVRYGAKYAFIRGVISKKNVDVLQNIMGLFQLCRPAVLYKWSRKHLTISLSPHRRKMFGDKLCSKSEFTSFLTDSVAAYYSFSSDKQIKTDKEILLFLNGFDSNLNYDLRLISLYRCLESIDGTNTLDSRKVSSLFSLSLDDAKFIIKVRNYLVHKGYSLKESLVLSYNDIASHGVSLNLFDALPNKKQIEFKFYLFMIRKMADLILNIFGLSTTYRILSMYKAF